MAYSTGHYIPQYSCSWGNSCINTPYITPIKDNAEENIAEIRKLIEEYDKKYKVEPDIDLTKSKDNVRHINWSSLGPGWI